MSRPLKILDLFSGIGGFSLGLERAGMETMAFCEQDTLCKKVLKKHWPAIPVFSDVRKLNRKILAKNNIGQIDVLTAGFPCQDVSVAKVNGRGLKGEKSGLWKEVKRLIKELKPKYALIENVANLRTRGLAEVLKDLWEVGYDCEWHIISAASLGPHCPHVRERIWILSYPGRSRRFLNRTQRSQEESSSPPSHCPALSVFQNEVIGLAESPKEVSHFDAEKWRNYSAYSILISQM